MRPRRVDLRGRRAYVARCVPLAAALALAACSRPSRPWLPLPWDTGTTDDTAVPFVDEDGDGWAPPEDCDDTDPDRHPRKAEVCNGIDDDCNGEVDENADPAWPDEDFDGWGATGPSVPKCSAGGAWSRQSGDCDDTRNFVHPGALEICNGLDDDCDPTTPEDGHITEYRPGFSSHTNAINRGATPNAFSDPEHPALLEVRGAVTLAICPGTYFLSLVVFDTDGIYGIGDPVLSGGQTATPLTVHAAFPNTTVTGLTFRDGEGTAHSTTGDEATEGGLVALTHGSLVLDTVTLEGGRADRGGAVFVAGGATLRAVDVTVRGNTATLEGGGIYTAGGGALSVERSTLVDNHALTGAALSLGPESTASMTDTLVSDHADTYNALYVREGATLSVQGQPGTGPFGVIRTGGPAIRWKVGAEVHLRDVDFGTGADANTVDLQPYLPGEPLYGLGDDVTLDCEGLTCTAP